MPTMDQLWEHFFYHLRVQRRAAGTLSLYSVSRQKFASYLTHPHSWKLDQCRQLWQDLQDLTKNQVTTHFMGSAVYVQEEEGSAAGGGPSRSLMGSSA